MPANFALEPDGTLSFTDSRTNERKPFTLARWPFSVNRDSTVTLDDQSVISRADYESLKTDLTHFSAFDLFPLITDTTPEELQGNSLWFHIQKDPNTLSEAQTDALDFLNAYKTQQSGNPLLFSEDNTSAHRLARFMTGEEDILHFSQAVADSHIPVPDLMRVGSALPHEGTLGQMKPQSFANPDTREESPWAETIVDFSSRMPNTGLTIDVLRAIGMSDEQIISLALDLTPVVGTGKSAVEFVTGRDPVTDEEVNRALALIGLIPLGKYAVRGGKVIVEVTEAGASFAFRRGGRIIRVLFSKFSKDPGRFSKEFSYLFNFMSKEDVWVRWARFIYQRSSKFHEAIEEFFGGKALIGMEYWDAHHIVPIGLPGFEEARNVLYKLGITFDDKINGVPVPPLRKNITYQNPRGQIPHADLHGEEYRAFLYENFVNVYHEQGSAAAKAALERIGKMLFNGS